MNAETSAVTFKRDEYGDVIASTGERIAKYNGRELWGRGSTGWYITGAEGEFNGIKFNTQAEAKNYLIRIHNPAQYIELVIAKVGA